METQQNVTHSIGHHRRADVVCYAPLLTSINGVWQGDSPFDFMLPLFIIQVMLIVIATRICKFILSPFRPPKVVTEILVGLPPT